MKHEESKLQISCVKWFDLQYPQYKLNLFAIPNEGARTPQNGARMKAQGRRAGVADMFLAIPKREIKRLNLSSGVSADTVVLTHGLFIEFKADKGKQSEQQFNFELNVIHQCYLYEIIRDFDSFKNLIEDYIS